MSIEVNKYDNDGRDRLSIINGDEYFKPVVNGVELSMVAETEDMAMLIGLGRKYDGMNSQFPKMAARILNIDTEWNK